MYELFDADLGNDTMTRVTHGFEGEDWRSEELPEQERPGTDPYQDEQGAYSPSFSADGNTLAFASTADNLVFGDGNEAPDAFVVHRVLPPSAGSPAVRLGRARQPVRSLPPWKLGVTATSLADGSVRLYARSPAPAHCARRRAATCSCTRPSRAGRLIARYVASSRDRDRRCADGGRDACREPAQSEEGLVSA